LLLFKVPWERVFVTDDAALPREIYIRTPSHCYGNHQIECPALVETEVNREAETHVRYRSDSSC